MRSMRRVIVDNEEKQPKKSGRERMTAKGTGQKSPVPWCGGEPGIQVKVLQRRQLEGLPVASVAGK